MKEKYYSILAKFLNDTKRERILFELQSKKKRENAFSKLTVFSECFENNHIFCDLTRLEETEALQKIKQTVGKTSGDLVADQIVLETAAAAVRQSYLAHNAPP